MNRKQLEYFIEAYRCRNIQMAANHLYITHQGLSRVIRSLEEELGETLFLRSNRGLEPTDYATALTRCGPNSVIRFLDDPNNGQMMYLVERYSTPPTRAGRCFKTYLLDWIQGHRSQLTEQTSQF